MSNEIKTPLSAVDQERLDSARKIIAELDPVTAPPPPFNPAAPGAHQQDSASDSSDALVDLIPEVVACIKPCHREPDYGDKPSGDNKSTVPSHYYITYVTTFGQQQTVPCTRDVWRWLHDSTPWFDVHAEWIFNKQGGTVVGIIRKPHLRQGPLATRFNADPDDLVLQKTGNVFEPVTLPLRFTPAVLKEALDSLNEAGNVKPGNRVGRFIVKQVQSDDQMTVVVLDFKEE
jgi:hypothetical protein